MKKKLLLKLKNLVKYIFVSNPLTIGCVFTSILLLAANGITGGILCDKLLWFMDNQRYSNAIFYGILGLIALIGAGKAGLKSNEEADRRKSGIKKERQEKKKFAKARKIAVEQLAKEKKAESLAMQAAAQTRFEQLFQQAKGELTAKVTLKTEQPAANAAGVLTGQSAIYNQPIESNQLFSADQQVSKRPDSQTQSYGQGQNHPQTARQPHIQPTNNSRKHRRA